MFLGIDEALQRLDAHRGGSYLFERFVLRSGAALKNAFHTVAGDSFRRDRIDANIIVT